MNREILFRGFHEDKNEKETICLDGKQIKGEWVQGDLWCNPYGKRAICIVSPINNQGTTGGNECIEETISQYTGLTDKNGKKIFEGDIVNFKTTAYHFKNCRIKYQSCHARYCAIDNKGYEYPMDKTFEYEIIGNIFSNPELLRSEDK